MRRLIVLTPAFVLVAACGGGPAKQEGVSERESAARDRSVEDSTLSQPQDS